ncbi:MAG: alanine racemase [Burkholderiaceae bacterium]
MTPVCADTPCLILDRLRLQANCRRFLERADQLGVTLRPHVKTAKSADVARVACGGQPGPITVSTLLEAQRMVAAGFTDLLYAVTIVPARFERALALAGQPGVHLRLVTDSLPVAHQLVEATSAAGTDIDCLVEIDCGEHRGGLLPDDPLVLEIGAVLDTGRRTRLGGVMTHGGQSYGARGPASVPRIAAIERDAAVTAAGRLGNAGLPCPVVSVGSTPTFLHAEHLAGVTEVRCGVYVFFDVSQAERGICEIDDLALSVLSTVIGHNRAGARLLLDAGGLALSKDLGASGAGGHPHYGLVCHAETLEPLGLVVDTVYQEHGCVPVADPAWYERLPVGARVRILPNHACMTAAGGYGQYLVLDEGRLVARWPRFDGW